ncbi:hypothetical protein [Paenibacillus alkalitolerans]|uniref:hypothetical protein n=1 Tax=Paenibacillus alkalitolerans TaxID=2799335 RepID=UPI0018F7C6C2|nr:hypothetical protein [Paenibacillus alkalitolerans]
MKCWLKQLNGIDHGAAAVRLFLIVHPDHSELEWLSAMKSMGLILPEAVSNQEGVFVTDAATSGGQRFYSSLLRWIEGERLEKGA